MLLFITSLLDCDTVSQLSDTAATHEVNPLLLVILGAIILFILALVVFAIVDHIFPPNEVAKASKKIQKTARAGRRAIDEEYHRFLAQLYKHARK